MSIDEHAATELRLFIDNDGDLYRQQTTSIHKNLVTKLRGTKVYSRAGAVKLFGYLVEAGAKKYAREFGDASEWHKMFPVATRRAVAEQLAEYFEDEANLGNYDDYLPKKYQNSPTVIATARANERHRAKFK